MRVLWWVALLFSLASRLTAQNAPSLEHQVQAACLVKFTSFIEWPATPTNAATNETFKIGILGSDPFGSYFDEAVKTETVKGRPVQLKRGREIAELEDCPVIYFGASESKRLAELLRQLEKKPVLTVAGEPESARRGVMINFVKKDGKVRFEFNLAAAERAGLRFSAKLKQVGTIVVPGHTAADK